MTNDDSYVGGTASDQGFSRSWDMRPEYTLDAVETLTSPPSSSATNSTIPLRLTITANLLDLVPRPRSPKSIGEPSFLERSRYGSDTKRILLEVAPSFSLQARSTNGSFCVTTRMKSTPLEAKFCTFWMYSGRCWLVQGGVNAPGTLTTTNFLLFVAAFRSKGLGSPSGDEIKSVLTFVGNLSPLLTTIFNLRAPAYSDGLI
ncbi:hypothetical protein OGATHE_001971 [Ogataea polymorpha]|uniref:Uncharacterized protein n=1 Tax=Ogataea polymorpha TaxID=460523 RepID=A0A9P8PL37_9ASCO|nr:hypothetical protein OGATHE_001971 [Ogataea polymorpha]